MLKKISPHKIVISLLISFWIVVTVIVLDLLRIQSHWPTFAVLNLLTIIGFTKQNIIKIFSSCFAGIGFSLLYIFSCGALTPYLGALFSGLLMLLVVIFVILVFDEVLPVCLNVHTIIIFSYCLVNAGEFAASWYHTVISAAVGGGVALAGILGIIKISPKLMKKSRE